MAGANRGDGTIEDCGYLSVARNRDLSYGCGVSGVEPIIKMTIAEPIHTNRVRLSLGQVECRWGETGRHYRCATLVDDRLVT